ncbi:MAG: aromatic ring-opening dioxygenase catalytic subunit (LigB family) [Myxococcota bacterium]|jgi:aromatic ring-opening dioxygenase catalytic subunit (LigB family)
MCDQGVLRELPGSMPKSPDEGARKNIDLRHFSTPSKPGELSGDLAVRVEQHLGHGHVLHGGDVELREGAAHFACEGLVVQPQRRGVQPGAQRPHHIIMVLKENDAVCGVPIAEPDLIDGSDGVCGGLPVDDLGRIEDRLRAQRGPSPTGHAAEDLGVIAHPEPSDVEAKKLDAAAFQAPPQGRIPVIRARKEELSCLLRAGVQSIADQGDLTEGHHALRGTGAPPQLTGRDGHPRAPVPREKLLDRLDHLLLPTERNHRSGAWLPPDNDRRAHGGTGEEIVAAPDRSQQPSAGGQCSSQGFIRGIGEHGIGQHERSNPTGPQQRGGARAEGEEEVQPPANTVVPVDGSVQLADPVAVPSWEPGGLRASTVERNVRRVPEDQIGAAGWQDGGEGVCDLQRIWQQRLGGTERPRLQPQGQASERDGVRVDVHPPQPRQHSTQGESFCFCELSGGGEEEGTAAHGGVTDPLLRADMRSKRAVDDHIGEGSGGVVAAVASAGVIGEQPGVQRAELLDGLQPSNRSHRPSIHRIGEIGVTVVIAQKERTGTGEVSAPARGGEAFPVGREGGGAQPGEEVASVCELEEGESEEEPSDPLLAGLGTEGGSGERDAEVGDSLFHPGVLALVGGGRTLYVTAAAAVVANTYQGAEMTVRMPAAYVPHGGGPWPFVDLGIDASETAPLQAYLSGLGERLPEKPRALLVVSAHWEEAQPTVMSHPKPPMLYDYYGFPQAAYSIQWPAPGSPQLAGKVAGLLEAAGIESGQDAERGFDHGTFVPLMLTYPDAQIPTVQISLKAGLDPEAHLAIGRALSPLRDEGVFIVGSGMSSHNMQAFRMGRPLPASVAFDGWLRGVVEAPAAERDAGLHAWASAPGARGAHPREEHLLPLMVVAGAAGEDVGEIDYAGSFGWQPLLGVRFG